jgi:hypothetical protein
MRGSFSARTFQSLKRRGLLSVSRTIVILRFVSTLSCTWREDGNTMPMMTNSAATIAREIRISIKRVIR